MHTLEHSASENVHIIHTSVSLLLFRGAAAWLTVAAVFLLGQWAWGLSGPSVLPSSVSPASVAAGNAWLYVLLFVLYGGIILYVVLQWIYNYYVIEQQDIVVKSGIIFKRESSFDLSAIQSIEVNQGLVGRLCNFGSVKLYSPVLDKYIYLSYIPNPYEQAQFIQKMHPTRANIHLFPKGLEGSYETGGNNPK